MRSRGLAFVRLRTIVALANKLHRADLGWLIERLRADYRKQLRDP